MAITASFEADFSQFTNEVNKAETELVQFETQTTKTSTAIVGMSTASTTTAPKVATLQQTFSKFDGILGAMGINAAPIAKFVTDIGGYAGASAVGLGALGTAATVAATGLGSFLLTRGLLAKFFPELDGWIANTTAKLLGFGDVAGQTAGNVQDTINKAIADGAPAWISFADAVAFNTKKAEENRKAAKDAADAYADWKAATDAVLIAEQNHAAVLNTINGTVVEAAKYALDLGVSQDKVATAYNLSAAQIAAVVAALKAEKEEAKLVADEHKRQTDEIKKHYDAVQAVRDKFFGADAIAQAKLYAEAINTNKTSIQQLNEEGLREFQKVMIAANEAMVRGGQAASAENLQFSQMAVEAGKMLEALNPVVKVTDDLAKEQWEYVTALDAGLVAMKKAKDEADKIAADAAGKKKEFAGGALVPGQGQVLARMAPGTGYDLFGRPGIQPLGAPTAPITINVNGNILSTANEVFRMMSEATRRSFASGGNRLPV